LWREVVTVEAMERLLDSWGMSNAIHVSEHAKLMHMGTWQIWVSQPKAEF
jgi:hypothetical protein